MLRLQDTVGNKHKQKDIKNYSLQGLTRPIRQINECSVYLKLSLKKKEVLEM